MKKKWINHHGVQKLEEVLNLKESCGYITFLNTGVRDIGCDVYDADVHLVKPKRSKERRKSSQTTLATLATPTIEAAFIVCATITFRFLLLMSFFTQS